MSSNKHDVKNKNFSKIILTCSFCKLSFLSSQIRIRDPNQGGKDITEEIMAGSGSTTPPVRRPSSTPTPPQVGPTPEQDFSLLLTYIFLAKDTDCVLSAITVVSLSLLMYLQLIY